MKVHFLRATALGALVVAAACQDPTGPVVATSQSSSLVSVPTIFALGNHTCALTPANVAYCWGRNIQGQLGLQTNTDVETTPQDVVEPAGVSFVALGGGVYHTCGLTAAGIGYCWGENFVGQLGTRGTRPRNAPRMLSMPAGVTFDRISSGGGHFNCAISTANKAYCWGHNVDGQLGIGGAAGATRDRTTPTAVRKDYLFQAISTGFRHTCALDTTGAAYCWGANDTGRLGIGPNLATRTTPFALRMPVGVTFTQIAAGRDHTCALATTGRAYCWGGNINGELGINNFTGDPQVRPRPVRMPLGVTFTQIAAGDNHNCALGNNGNAYCWGSNISGQLGNGATGTDAFRPVKVNMPGGVQFSAVTASYHHSCAISTVNQAYCWGVNTNGELGTTDQFHKPVPTAVVGGAF